MKTLLLPVATCFLFVLLTACGQPPATEASAALANLTAVPSENGIVNFHTVHKFLFRSGALNANDMSTLAALQVKTILSLEDYHGDQAVADAERDEAAAKGLDFEWQPLSPSGPPSLSDLDAALAVLSDPARQPVLVHCKHGADRTGLVIAAYRIRFDHWSVAKARTELRSMGHPASLYFWDKVLDAVQ